MELDKHKIELLVKFFETHGGTELPGCKQIGYELIHNSKCIVPRLGGNIWVGGIGNFIKLNYDLPSHIDCVEYQFSVDEFVNSGFFQGSLPGHINSVSQEIKSLKQQLEEKEEQLKSIKEFHNEF